MDFFYDSEDSLTVLHEVTHRDGVRKAIGLSYRELPSYGANNTTDVFGNSVARAWYDNEGSLVGIELYSLHAKFFIKGKQLLGECLHVVTGFLSSNGIDVESIEGGTVVCAFNNHIRFYVPNFAELRDQATVDSVYLKVVFDN